MWDLPIYMGLVGSVAYVAYKLLYLMTGKEKLSASGRWILLRKRTAFFRDIFYGYMILPGNPAAGIIQIILLKVE